MANATVLPLASELKFFYWQNKPKLTVGLTASITDTTLYWSTPPYDETGAIITGSFLSGWINKAGKAEVIWVPAGAVAADGLSATGCVRGIDIKGIDYTVGDVAFTLALDGGSTGCCVIAAQSGELLRAAIQGLIATGAVGFTIGTNAGGTVTVYRATGAATKQGVLRWNTGTSKTEYSNDGVTWNSIDSATASNLLVVSGADTTPSNLDAKTASGTGVTRTILNPGGNEQLQISVNGTLAALISDVTASATEINQALDGISANVTFTNLNTLTGGSSADALHSHVSPSATFFATEAVTAGQTVALLPIEVEYFAQLTDANLALGDANARRRHAIKFVPGVTTSTLTTMQFRAAEAVNGATTLGDLTISIQTDTAGAPSGTVIANGTANAITQVTQRTWNVTQASRTATWAASPTLTAGTTYWLVFAVAGTDAANYLNFSVNSAHNESFLTFTRLTYDLDLATWGTSTTDATPFFWFNNQKKLLGLGLCPTDASWGGRTWSFIGFAKNNIAASASGLVYYHFAEGLTGLTAGSDYYLSETAGAITTTAPTMTYVAGTEPTAFAYKIGQAVSTTLFRINQAEKRIFISETTQLTATTTRKYVIWFRPKYTVVYGQGGEITAGGVSNSIGFIFPDATNHAIEGQIFSSGAVSGGGVASTLTQSLAILDPITGDGFNGVATLTDVGLTYTMTEVGSGQGYALLDITG